MELSFFIDETLMQIIKGVKSAQEKAKLFDVTIAPPLIFEGDANTVPYVQLGKRAMHINHVDFDVALTYTDSEENKTGIGVWFSSIGIGGQEKTDKKNVSVTNIKFSVPLMFYSIAHSSHKDSNHHE